MRLKGILIGIFAFSMVGVVQAGPEKKPQSIRWVLAHEPSDLFKRAADTFTKEISEKTEGELNVEVLTVSEYAKKYNNGEMIDQGQVVRYVQSGKIEMSQTYTTILGHYDHNLWVLDLPFLFRDHAHAQKIIEGEIGEKLYAKLPQKGIRGLAYTYSGGYRIIPAKKAITKLEDFKGLSLATSSSPVAMDVLKTVGAKATPIALEKIKEASDAGQINGNESTYVRFYSMKQNEHSSVVNDTGHSLFLTSIIMSEQFWKKIPEKYHAAIKEAALTAARIERKQSIEDSIATKEKCKTDGIPVITLSEKEGKRFKDALKPVYKKYKTYFSKDFVSQIEKI